jgi:hypothetical protein
MTRHDHFSIPTKRVRIKPKSFIYFPISYLPKYYGFHDCILLVQRHGEKIKIGISGICE